MRVYFLGTGTSQGIPVIGVDHPVCKSTDLHDKRLRSSIWITSVDIDIVIDCGPDFRQQMLRSGNTKIDALLITHEHSDHTAGLDDIRPYCYMNGKILPFFALKRVINSIQKRFDYFFETENRYPGAPHLQLNEIDFHQSFAIGHLKIDVLKVWHGDLPIAGYKIGDMAYITDCKYLDESAFEKLYGIKLLIISALRLMPHDTHANLDMALKTIERIKPQQAYLTHIGFQMGFHAEISKLLPTNVFLAYDNLVVSI